MPHFFHHFHYHLLLFFTLSLFLSICRVIFINIFHISLFIIISSSLPFHYIAIIDCHFNIAIADYYCFHITITLSGHWLLHWYWLPSPLLPFSDSYHWLSFLSLRHITLIVLVVIDYCHYWYFAITPLISLIFFIVINISLSLHYHYATYLHYHYCFHFSPSFHLVFWYYSRLVICFSLRHYFLFFEIIYFHYYFHYCLRHYHYRLSMLYHYFFFIIFSISFHYFCRCHISLRFHFRHCCHADIIISSPFRFFRIFSFSPFHFFIWLLFFLRHFAMLDIDYWLTLMLLIITPFLIDADWYAAAAMMPCFFISLLIDAASFLALLLLFYFATSIFADIFHYAIDVSPLPLRLRWLFSFFASDADDILMPLLFFADTLIFADY